MRNRFNSYIGRQACAFLRFEPARLSRRLPSFYAFFTVLILSVIVGAVDCSAQTNLKGEAVSPASAAAILADWLLQDYAYDPAQGQPTGKTADVCFKSDKENGIEKTLVEKVFAQIGDKSNSLKPDFESLQSVPGADPRWLDLYKKACQIRRDARLQIIAKEAKRIVFTKHYNLGGSHYAYTEGLSDAQAERHFQPGSQLCLLETNDKGEMTETVLLDDPNGVIRDPDVAFDGSYIVFAWKKSDRLDDYHLYKIIPETGEITQLTFGLGYADYEPCCLPDGDIAFNSTRCSQIVDCWWTEVSNIYRINAEGKYMRRVSFDQVHDNYPTLTEDGRIIYTRWDYNDRGQIFPQGLFQMNLDGTGQTELYGNNSWFPTTILHARNIPGTGKLICVFSGHHTHQRGKLGVLDPKLGRQENSGATLAAPIRETEAVHVDAYGQQGEQFCYPFPLTENDFIVAYRPNAQGNQDTQAPFSLYYMTMDGQRELLATDSRLSCNQNVVLKPKNLEFERPSMVDPTLDYATYYMQNVFMGPGLEGIDRSIVRSLRVVALGFRTVGLGSNGNGGPAGGAMSSTPISVGGGAWDTKTVLGEAAIYKDGSACFKVPPKTPIYFQVIDTNGHVIQTMRSWSTLQPGEQFSCLGCHEDKNTGTRTNVARGITEAMRRGPQDLEPFYGAPRGFSFAKEIQPILDKHCIKCHDNSDRLPPYMGTSSLTVQKSKEELGLTQLTPPVVEWSYTTKKPADGWTTAFPIPDSQTGKAGFGNVPYLETKNTPWTSKDIWMTTELTLPEGYKPAKLFAWLFHDEDIEVYINGNKLFDESGFVQEYLLATLHNNPLKSGKNVIALHCSQSGGGQGVDLALYEDSKSKTGESVVPSDKPFSLKGTPVEDMHARRAWSESYLNLTGTVKQTSRAMGARPNRAVQWINVQESPAMLSPYHSGAVKSQLCAQFDGDKPHNDVKLSKEEKDKLACWIDLLVPFCGDYEEANLWNDQDKQKSEYYQAKAKSMKELDEKNYQAWIKSQSHRRKAKQEDEAAPGSENPYRNVALGASATSNSEYQNMDCYKASCAVDGKTANRGHGGAFPSWGPDKDVKDLFWNVEFKSEVVIDQLVLYIRADFPHDDYFREITLTFSNGFKTTIRPEKTEKPQVFRFPQQSCKSVRLDNMKSDGGWAALSEVEFYGIAKPDAQ